MDPASQIQILDKAGCISLHNYILVLVLFDFVVIRGRFTIRKLNPGHFSCITIQHKYL